MLRKVAVAAASKPHVEIRQDGDQFYIKTSTTVRTTEINFKVGEGFEEETVDGRKCRVRPRTPSRVPPPTLSPRQSVPREVCVTCRPWVQEKPCPGSLPTLPRGADRRALCAPDGSCDPGCA